jgi:hypothetical protein
MIVRPDGMPAIELLDANGRVVNKLMAEPEKVR